MDVLSAVNQHIEMKAGAMGSQLNAGKSELILPSASPTLKLSSLFAASLLIDAATGMAIGHPGPVCH